MSSGGEMASEDNANSESENVLNDDESGGTLRRRKIVKCAKEKIEQGIFVSMQYTNFSNMFHTFSFGTNKKEDTVCWAFFGS